ncbi:MAG: biotin--[acetyl-CoA-carboxylase] ligase, partial [Anaerolineae bacterium]
CGLALVEAVNSVSGAPVLLKWPNDLIVEDDHGWRKVAGMLSETGGGNAQPGFLVVGVGLNVNISRDDLPDLAPNATSLLVEQGQSVDRVKLLDAFLERVEALYEKLRSGWDPLPEWRERLAWLGRTVCVHTPLETVEGKFEGVDAEGALVLRLPEGFERHFPVGDVTLRLRETGTFHTV